MANGYMFFDTDAAQARLLLADESGLDTAQDIEWRWDVALDDYTPATSTRFFIDRWNTVSSNRTWRLEITTGGAILVRMGNSDGTARSGTWQLDMNAGAPTNGVRYHFRVTLNGNSSGNTVCTLYTREADDNTDLESDTGWTQQDSASVAGTQTFLTNSSAPVAMNNQSEAGGNGGSHTMVGKWYRFLAWGDLTKTTKLFDVDFRTDDSITSTTWDDNVRTGHWAMQGSTLTWVAPTADKLIGRSIHYDFAAKLITIESGV